MKFPLHKKALMFSALALTFAVYGFADTVQDAQSLSVAQSIVDYGTSTRISHEMVLIMWPQNFGSLSVSDKLKAEVQKALVETLGMYTDSIVFSDGEIESQMWTVLQYVGVSDEAQAKRREELSEKARFLITPLITNKNAKYSLRLSITDLITGQRRTTESTSAYNTEAAVYAHPGACDEAILLLCNMLNIRLTSTEKDVLQKGIENLTPQQQVEIEDERIKWAESAIDDLEDITVYSPQNKALYDMLIAQHKARLGLALSDAEQLALTGQETPASTPTGEAEADATASEKETKQKKEKTEKPETKPVWKFGQDGMNGVYFEAGVLLQGPDLALEGLFEINNWLSVGGDIGFMMLPGYSHNEYTERYFYNWNNVYWNGSSYNVEPGYDHSNSYSCPTIFSFNARVQGGISFHRFYAYGFTGIGMYVASFGSLSATGLSVEGGVGLTSRFFSQHFTVGGFVKLREFIGLGGGPSIATGIILGWNF